MKYPLVLAVLAALAACAQQVSTGVAPPFTHLAQSI